MITLIRELYADNSTKGKLYINDVYICDTLELPWKNNEKIISCIPIGVYGFEISFSPARKGCWPRLTGVEGRDGILVHTGNWPKDILGCIAVGTDTGTSDYIANSRTAYKKFMAAVGIALGDNPAIKFEVKNKEGVQ